MAYQEITQHNSPNYTPTRNVQGVFGHPRTIQGVVYHWWGDPKGGATFSGVVNWLCRPNGASSAHTVGEGGKVAWIVNAWDAAWHAGHAWANASTIGYECNPRLSDADYQTMGEFQYNVEKEYKRKLPIYVHKQFQNTACSPIDKDRIRRIADQYHSTAPTPKPTWQPMITPRSMRTTYRVNIYDVLTRVVVGSIEAGKETPFLQKIEIGGSVYLRSQWSVDNNKNWGVLLSQLSEIPPKPAPQPDWIKKKKEHTAKLTVLPAEGVKVFDFVNRKYVNDNIIPKGTNIDVVAMTEASGQRYYMSSYASTNGFPWGIPVEKLGVPAVPSVDDKPEWLKNLQDIEDIDMWTRAETPVLNLADGSVGGKLPINTKVRATHSTEIVDIKLLVLAGEKTAIETIYLSDKPIAEPAEDIQVKDDGLLRQILEKLDWLISKLNMILSRKE